MKEAHTWLMFRMICLRALIFWDIDTLCSLFMDPIVGVRVARFILFFAALLRTVQIVLGYTTHTLVLVVGPDGATRYHA